MFLRVFFLAFLFALDIDAGRAAWLLSENKLPSSRRAPLCPSCEASSSLPNSCELIATEALRRMERAQVWARVLIIQWGDKNEAHALCVYQPHWQICVYDDTGTYDLETNSHDPDAIANLLSIRLKRPIKSARFLK